MMERTVERHEEGGAPLDPATRLAQLKEEHAQLKARLAELESHVSLTSDEQVERIRIKKLKLAKKDEIQSLSAQLGQR